MQSFEAGCTQFRYEASSTGAAFSQATSSSLTALSPTVAYRRYQREQKTNPLEEPQPLDSCSLARQKAPRCWPVALAVRTMGPGSDGERDPPRIESNPRREKMEATAPQPLLPCETSFASEPALPQATSQQHTGRWGNPVPFSLNIPLFSFFIKYLQAFAY